MYLWHNRNSTTVTWSVWKSDWYCQLQSSGSQQFELGGVARLFFYWTARYKATIK